MTKKLDIYAPVGAGLTSSVSSERYAESLSKSFASKASGKTLNDENNYTMTVYQVSDYLDDENFDFWEYDPVGWVREFHETMGHPVRWHPTKLDKNEITLRIGLITEELEELEDALYKGTAAETAKELADLLYVVYGLCVANGMWPDIEEVFRRVHQSNMSKNGPDGKPIYNDQGKIMKGSDYKAPDFSDMKELDYDYPHQD